MPLLDTGREVDTIRGGAGNDRISAGYGDNVDGGDSGRFSSGDSLAISFQGAPTGVTFDGRLATQTIGGGTITGIESFTFIQGKAGVRRRHQRRPTHGFFGFSNTIPWHGRQ